MAEIGTYYITVMPSMNKFTSAVKNELNGLGKEAGGEFKTSFGDILKGSAVGTMLGNLGSTLGSKIMGGLSTGIRRIDTIQNFPKVMQALGFEAGQAGESVQLIMDRLDGLPTATQDVVAMTQAFADSTGDLDLATRAALGFNDMMLASGASVGEVTQAQGVLNRVLGKGSATVAQWQSLQSVMPAQLAAVARELGGESMSVEDLREALNNGEISWNDFLQAVVRLDTEGSDAMASFRDQAIANSTGIGTAVENVTNRIGAGWADILDSIGREDISGAINDVSYGIRDAMYAVGDAIDTFKEKISETSIVENASKVFDKLADAISDLWEDGGPDILGGITDGIIDLTDNALQWLVDNGDLVTTSVWGMAGALAALSGWKIGTGLTMLPGVLAGIGAAVAANPLGAIALGISIVVGALYGFFTQTETGKKIWSDFTTLLSETWEGLKADFAVLTETISREWESFKTTCSNAANAIKEGVTQAWESLKTNTKNAWENLKTNTKQAWENVKTSVTEKVTSLKTAVSTAWENVKTNTRTSWENIKTSATEKVNSMRTAVVDRFNTLKSDVKQAWENIKNAISDKITAAKNKVSDMVNAIKGLFNFHISWPHIPLPHFSVSGSPNPLDWLTQGVPHISVSWYAKGGVFDGASLIGVGEKGPEAVLPLNDRTMSSIAGLIANKMEAAPSVVVTGNTFYVRKESDIDAIADAIARRTARQRGARL